MLGADRKLLYAAVVVGAVAVAELGYMLVNAPGPSFEKCPNVEAEQRDANGTNPIARGIPSREGAAPQPEQADPTPHHENCAEDPALAEYTYALARYTAGLVAATIFLAALGVFQLVFLRRADETGRLTAQAASDNAKSALNSGRAHIWMKGVILTFVRNEDASIKQIDCKYEIWNGGSTPGLANGVYLSAFFGKIADWPEIGMASEVTHIGLVGPNAGHSKTVILTAKSADDPITDNRSEDWAYIVFGYVAYTDIIRPEIEHQAGFAYRIKFPETGDASNICSFQGPNSYWFYT